MTSIALYEQLIHPPIGGLLDYLWIWDVCVINMCVQVFVWICLIIFWYSAIQVRSNASRLVDAVHFWCPWDIHFESLFSMLLNTCWALSYHLWLEGNFCRCIFWSSVTTDHQKFIKFLQVCYNRWMRFLGWLHRRLVSANETSREGAIPTQQMRQFLVCSRHVSITVQIYKPPMETKLKFFKWRVIF